MRKKSEGNHKDTPLQKQLLFSVIVPVYNRPDEVGELLESLTMQTFTDFEVVIVEDGSEVTCREVCEGYAGTLDLHYYYKSNSGPGDSRNYGAARAKGDYLIILDSDVVLPEGYLSAIDAELRREPADAFGGADAAHPSFTPTQKAISYSMTSFFTTGGIRGGRKKLDKFYPRSYNMGVRREEYARLGGFSKMRFGEDIDLSIRIFEAGLRCRLMPEAWVWHKRRTDFRKFFRQVFNSGIARINLHKHHPGSMKLVHLLPAIFTIGVTLLILLSAVGRAMMYYDGLHWRDWYYVCALPWLPILLFALLIFVDASVRYRSMSIGLRSIAAAFIQLYGYGAGFLCAWWQRCVRGKDEFHAFQETFYK